MKIFFSKLATQKLEDAAEYYELEEPGLGRRFKQEVKRRLSGFPNILRRGRLSVVK